MAWDCPSAARYCRVMSIGQRWRTDRMGITHAGRCWRVGLFHRALHLAVYPAYAGEQGVGDGVAPGRHLIGQEVPAPEFHA